MGERVSIEAAIEQITFRNESNGWTVMQLRKGRNRVTAVGSVLNVNVGENVAITGEWTEHPDYGRQIKIETCEIAKPSRLSDIEKYLSSGVIKGIGPATARLIVQNFGKHTLDILDSDPQRIADIPGIGPKRAAMIAESYHQQLGSRQTLMFLQKSGFSNAMASRVYKLYGAATETILRTNPYQMVRDIPGIGFGTADRIAATIGIPPDSPFRIQSGILHVLQEASIAQGHVYLPFEELCNASVRLMNTNYELVKTAVDELVLHSEIRIEDIPTDEGMAISAVYTDNMLHAESDVAYRLAQIARAPKPYVAKDLDKRIIAFERENGIVLSAEQRSAVKLAATSGVAVITGGPGTGKTTIIKCILSLMPRGSDTALCAPTGRAAKRMTEATGAEAKTIHRLLEYGGEDEGNFARNKEHPLKVRALICDEVSMVDIILMRSLLHALTDGTRLILVGDADQLPSVGPGCVLRDILQSGAIPCARLTEIHRQSEDSMIVLNAHNINSGEMPVLNKKGGDFFIDRRETATSAAQAIVDLARRRLPSFTGADPLTEIQILAPAKKGEAGVWALNRLLQQSFNPHVDGTAERSYGENVFRIGDKVMHVKNDYNLEWRCGAEYGVGVFNGDMGIITDIDEDTRIVTVKFDDDHVVEYDDSAIDELELAYCISVHKSQGSEFPVIIMPVMPGPKLLTARNLLYTAVTRAKRCVVLVGRESVIREMIDNNYISRRYTALRHRIIDYAGVLKKSVDEVGASVQASIFEEQTSQENAEFLKDISADDAPPWE